MATSTHAGIDRRQFFHASGAGLGMAAASHHHALGGDDQPRPRNNKPKIRIGTRISPAWLHSPNDNDLRFLKQIGVDYVDITLDKITGYGETGRFSHEALKAFIDRLSNVGLRIERANSLGPYYLNAHLGRAEGDREIDNLKKVAALVAEAEIPVFGIQACQASLHLREGARAGWSRRQGRGGYDYPYFDQASSETAPKPAYRVTAEQLWRGLLNIYKQVIPVIEGSKTRLAMHGNDPPLAQYLGNPQILCRFADFDRLFREVPSKHSGITFCVGTRYESGQDVFEGIRHFGKQSKLFHVHFRNVRGTLPAQKSYGEVFVDDGDLDMGRVVRALHDVDYDGVIDYDHPISIIGDQPLPKQYIAFAVGYMRGLLHGLPG